MKATYLSKNGLHLVQQLKKTLDGKWYQTTNYQYIYIYILKFSKHVLPDPIVAHFFLLGNHSKK
jgi:hypothetical protein